MKIHQEYFKIGKNWHTDSRYVNNKRISNGFSYLVIVALEDFTKDTASSFPVLSPYCSVAERPMHDSRAALFGR